MRRCCACLIFLYPNPNTEPDLTQPLSLQARWLDFLWWMRDLLRGLALLLMFSVFLRLTGGLSAASNCVTVATCRRVSACLFVRMTSFWLCGLFKHPPHPFLHLSAFPSTHGNKSASEALCWCLTGLSSMVEWAVLLKRCQQEISDIFFISFIYLIFNYGHI